jgi:hypothetical protein
VFLLKYSLAVCAIRTRYKVDDDSSIQLRRRFVASARYRFS